MRFADLLRLSLSALWQQKMRGLLTALGVVFGAFVLVFSLSLGQGVQHTLERESHRTAFLRRIIVHPGWGKAANQATEDVKVDGDMSEEKRQRLRQALIERKQQFTMNHPRVNLTQERLADLRNLEHVESVSPLVMQQSWAILGGQTQLVGTSSVEMESATHRQRIVAGDFFREPDERSVIVSEMTCYLLGVKDEAAVQRLIGTKLRLEFRHEPPPVGLNVYLMKGDGNAPTRQEKIALEKIQVQLPAFIDQLTLLTQAEKDAVRPKKQMPLPSPTVYQDDLTIVGVMRMEGAEEHEWWSGRSRYADVLLPRATALEMYFKQKELAGAGVEEATIIVDREENVREVLKHVQEMNLQAFAPIEDLERERLIYLLIFATMACVAAVALLVAALGIANTMLMSVLERTREIGIFKAVGAGDGTVQLVFLIEGAFIGLIGGAAGLLVGWAASFPADAWVRNMVSRDLKVELKESIFLFPWWLSVSVILFAVVVTTLAAVFPARRAARVNPVTALRNE